MKTTTMKWALMAIMSGSMFFSCKKEKENTPECGKTLTGLAGSYKLTALQYKSGANAEPADYMAYMDDCEKDNLLVLKSDGTYDYNDIGSVCSPDGTEHGTWVVEGNTLTSDGILNGTIGSYDCKTLVYYVGNAIEKGDRLTYTLVKQ